MAINQNHTFDDLEGVKCAIVEKNCTPARVEFLKGLLEHNGYTVIVAKSPPPKAAAPKPDETPPPPPPETFTVGVSDVTFNATNAIYGRLLRSKDGHVVSMKYWQQKEQVSDDFKPYFAKTWR